MFISNVHVENFRSFTTIDIPLTPFSIIAGKNDTGKSNLVEAINILLYNSRGNYYAKSLSKYDFNTAVVLVFKEAMRATYTELRTSFNAATYIAVLLDKAPKIVIRLRFEDAKTPYEKSLLRDWLNCDDEMVFFEIEYIYSLKSSDKLVATVKSLHEEELLDSYIEDFSLFLEFYDYSLKSTNNGKNIDFTKIKNFAANTINAERDTFSSGDTANSIRIIAKIIEDGLSLKDKTTIIEKYQDFFSGIQSVESFRDIYGDIVEQNASIKEFINEIRLQPNAKKYRDILENITLSYGSNMLFQQGLGTRNMILLLTLYSYFLHDNAKHFNLVCIEEPEAHLDINNLKVATEFFQKSKDKNSLTQLLLSTHSNQIINKLDMRNITLLIDDHNAISLADVDEDLVYYLAKRENFDTLNMLFATKLIFVEGSTEEIYLNCLLQKFIINDIRVLSTGQKGFRTFMDAWKAIHKPDTRDKLGILRDYDNNEKTKLEHEAYNSAVIKVSTTAGKEFESDIISCSNNLQTLNTIFAPAHNEGEASQEEPRHEKTAEEMYEYMTSDKLNCIIHVCKAIENGTDISIPEYISTLLEWLR